MREKWVPKWKKQKIAEQGEEITSGSFPVDVRNWGIIDLSKYDPQAATHTCGCEKCHENRFNEDIRGFTIEKFGHLIWALNFVDCWKKKGIKLSSYW